MNKEISLDELFKHILKNLKWIILTTLAFMLVAFLYSSFGITKMYTASTTMIASFTTLDKEVDDIPNQITTTQTDSSEKLAEIFSGILDSDTAAEAIMEYLTEWKNIDKNMVRRSISMKRSPKTDVIMILSSTTPDPELSYDICMALREVAPKMIDKYYYGACKPLDKPTMPTGYSSPNIPKNTLVGAFFGALLSVAVLCAIKLLNNKITSERDIDTAYLGAVPTFDSKKGKTKRSDEEARLAAQNNFFIVESYKSIRTNLMYTFGSNKNGNIVAFSGAEINAGKSVTCANLAIAFAQNGFRILVVDADMRRPKQQKLFKKTHTEGLSRLISGQCSFEEAVIRGAAPNLDLIPAGPLPPNPSELLSVAAMDEFLEKVSAEYDYVFIDTPPINYVTDCLAFANKINGIILVARHGHTEKDDFAKAELKIKSINARIVGTIINDAVVEKSKKYYKNIYYYKSNKA